ncbi:hypothetical protein P168DRAFT_320931 [Aspergillus campestris IBT 28561]|uniref:Uncharacterized protein n=1 Tax=Aspergillus campestris (strain IBT 28561) TaxID=1392248 RepID=A0A2I1CUM4_ASPC2|nr:uncharacterized protein P168DRAFT_320931 [Aspergillus campestris IBT 28561]PKY01330.1 hypothetical protein P168DRAFT_320931 [Aspergillus campestris IBT 28561]
MLGVDQSKYDRSFPVADFVRQHASADHFGVVTLPSARHIRDGMNDSSISCSMKGSTFSPSCFIIHPKEGAVQAKTNRNSEGCSPFRSLGCSPNKTLGMRILVHRDSWGQAPMERDVLHDIVPKKPDIRLVQKCLHVECDMEMPNVSSSTQWKIKKAGASISYVVRTRPRRGNPRKLHLPGSSRPISFEALAVRRKDMVQDPFMLVFVHDAFQVWNIEIRIPSGVTKKILASAMART